MARHAKTPFWIGFVSNEGRDNRITYFLRNLVISAALILVVLAVYFTFYNVRLSKLDEVGIHVPAGVSRIALLGFLLVNTYIGFCMISRRLHDLGIPTLYSGIFTGIQLVISQARPGGFAYDIIQSIAILPDSFFEYAKWGLWGFCLILLFIPGQKHANRFGPVPGKPDTEAEARLSQAFE